MKQLEVAFEAARVGGEILSKYFRQGVQMRMKQACDLVSDADLESERAIVDVIHSTFPNHSILGEETRKDDAQADSLWIIDPLDGTTNFAHDIPHFAVSIGYYERGQPVCGVIFNPARGDWFHAVKGGGAFAGDQRVHVAGHATLGETLIGTGFYYDRGAVMEATLAAIGDLFRQQIHGIRRFGTASLDLVQVGCGMFGAFFEYQLAPWDFAAGKLFVEEAGGRVTTCTGADVPIARTSFLASNGLLHDAVQSIVARRLAEVRQTT